MKNIFPRLMVHCTYVTRQALIFKDTFILHGSFIFIFIICLPQNMSRTLLKYIYFICVPQCVLRLPQP